MRPRPEGAITGWKADKSEIPWPSEGGQQPWAAAEVAAEVVIETAVLRSDSAAGRVVMVMRAGGRNHQVGLRHPGLSWADPGTTACSPGLDCRQSCSCPPESLAGCRPSHVDLSGRRRGSRRLRRTPRSHVLPWGVWGRRQQQKEAHRPPKWGSRPMNQRQKAQHLPATEASRPPRRKAQRAPA